MEGGRSVVISKTAVKRERACRGHWLEIVGIFDPGELLTPAGRILGNHTVKGCLQRLISTLCLAISMRVESRC